MEYTNSKANWQEVFAEEFETLNSKLSSYNEDSLSKSKLRLCLEGKILDWKDYADWAQEEYGCASVQEKISEAMLEAYDIQAQQAFNLFSRHNFWNQDLLPVSIWENQIIVFGLQYNPNLQKIQNHIFVLAPLDVLNHFAKLLLKTKVEKDSANDAVKNNLVQLTPKSASSKKQKKRA